MARLSVSDEVRALLSRCAVTETSVTLPVGQLPRDLYEKVDRVLRAAGGRWNRKARAHLFERDPREALGLAVESGQVRDVQKDLQAFYTPPRVAALAVRAAEVSDDHFVLEPSAGKGAIVRAILDRAPQAHVRAFDVDRFHADYLRAAFPLDNVDVAQGDFLRQDVCQVDRVVMNPPFHGGQDMDHVERALRWVKPSGILVSILPPTTLTGHTRRHEAFREEALGRCSRVRTWQLPPGSFKESGTGVHTVLVRFEVARRG